MFTHVARLGPPRPTQTVRPAPPRHTQTVRPAPPRQTQDTTVQVQRTGTRVRSHADVENFQTYRRIRNVSILVLLVAMPLEASRGT